jgi:hypothetical protein
MVPELIRQLEKNSNPVAATTNYIHYGNDNFPYFDQLMMKQALIAYCGQFRTGKTLWSATDKFSSSTSPQKNSLKN